MRAVEHLKINQDNSRIQDKIRQNKASQVKSRQDKARQFKNTRQGRMMKRKDCRTWNVELNWIHGPSEYIKGVWHCKNLINEWQTDFPNTVDNIDSEIDININKCIEKRGV